MTITGVASAGATAVDFGTTAATNFTVVSDTQITATSSGGAAGTVDVTVTAPAARRPPRSADQFTYVAESATVTGVSSTTAIAEYTEYAPIPIIGDLQRAGHGDGDAAVGAECGQRRSRPTTPAGAAPRRSPSSTPWRPDRALPTWIIPRPRPWRSTGGRSKTRPAMRRR